MVVLFVSFCFGCSYIRVGCDGFAPGAVFGCKLIRDDEPPPPLRASIFVRAFFSSFEAFFFIIYYKSSGGSVKIKLKLATLPRSCVVCQFNLVLLSICFCDHVRDFREMS